MDPKIWFLLLSILAINKLIETNGSLDHKSNSTHKLSKRGLKSNDILVGKPSPQWWKSWWRDYISEVTDPTVRPYLLTGSNAHQILSLNNEVQTHIDDEEEEESELIPPQRPQIRTTVSPIKPSIVEKPSPRPLRPTVGPRQPVFRPESTTTTTISTDEDEIIDTTEEFIQTPTTRKPQTLPLRTTRPPFFRPQPTTTDATVTPTDEKTDFEETEEPIEISFKPGRPTATPAKMMTRFPIQTRPFYTTSPTVADEEVDSETPIQPPLRVPSPPPSFRPFQPQFRPTSLPPIKGRQPIPTIRPRPTFAPPVKGQPPPRPRPVTISPPEIEEQTPAPTISPAIKIPPKPTIRPVSRTTAQPPVKGQPPTQRPIPTLSPEEEEEVTKFTVKPRVTTPPPVKLPPTFRPKPVIPPTRPPIKGRPPIPPRTPAPIFIPRTSTVPPIKRPLPTRPIIRPRPTQPPEIEQEMLETTPRTRPRPVPTSPPIKAQPTIRPRTTPQPTFAPPVKGPIPTPRRPAPQPRPTLAPPVKAPPTTTRAPITFRTTTLSQIEEEETELPPIKGPPAPPKPTFRPTLAPPIKGQPPVIKPRPTLPPIKAPPTRATIQTRPTPPLPEIEGEVITEQPVPPSPRPQFPIKEQPTTSRPTFPPSRPRPTFAPPIKGGFQPVVTRAPKIIPRPTIAQEIEDDIPSVRPKTSLPPIKAPPQPTFRPRRPPIREEPILPTQRPIDEEEEEKTERPIRPRPVVPSARVPSPPPFRPRPTFAPPIKGSPPSVTFRPRPFPPAGDSQISTSQTPITTTTELTNEITELDFAISSTEPPFGTRTTRPKPRPFVQQPRVSPSPTTRPVPPIQRVPIRSSTTKTTTESPETTQTTSDVESTTSFTEDEITEEPIRPRPTPVRPLVRPPVRPSIPPAPSQRGLLIPKPLPLIPKVPERKPAIILPPVPRLPVQTLRPTKKPLIGIKTGPKPGTKDRVLQFNPQLGPAVTLSRPDRPLPNGTMPPCGLQGKNFCILTNDYPMSDVKTVVDKSFQRIRLMYEELQTVGDPELFQSHLGNSSASRGQFACQTESNFMRPGWAQDALTGGWMVIVNTDIFPQKVRTESCRRANEPCDFVAPFYESTCQQRFSLHRLIAIDPNDQNRSPVVALFKFPAGCSCRVDPIRRESKKKRKRETVY